SRASKTHAEIRRPSLRKTRSSRTTTASPRSASHAASMRTDCRSDFRSSANRRTIEACSNSRVVSPASGRPAAPLDSPAPVPAPAPGAGGRTDDVPRPPRARARARDEGRGKDVVISAALATIALGADHGGFELKEQLKNHLREQGHSIRDLGTNSKDPVDYPKIAKAVAELVASGGARFGIMIDGAGIGSAMTANKVPGILAAAAYNEA